MQRRAARPVSLSPADRGHNQGPPLEDRAEWGDGDAYIYFCWKHAHRKAWKHIPWEIALRRVERAEALGLTYEEYTLEILERGRYLHAGDEKRIAEIKRRRSLR